MTVFTPVQLIATQQAKLAILFALKKQALHGFQSLVKFKFLPVKVAPEKGVTCRQEALSRATSQIRALRRAGRMSLSTSELEFKIIYQTPAQAIKSARSHLSADPPTVVGALHRGVISMPRVAWQ